MKPTDFYTRPLSEAGIRVPLLLPDGSDSGEWLHVCGPDSAPYAVAQQKLLRRIAELGSLEDDKAKEEAANDILADSRAPLILAWSFAEKLTPESAREFLRNAPRVSRQIENVAGNVANFTGPGLPDSTSGPGSNEPSKAAAAPRSKKGSASGKASRPASLHTSSDTGASSSPAA